MSSASKYIPHYTVDDYQQWAGDWELWGGVAVSSSPSPYGMHSRVVLKVMAGLMRALDSAGCEATALVAIDWIISDDTVLRPDGLVVCGPPPEKHVTDIPAIVVEVLSESTRQRDLEFKRQIYQEQTVPYYLVADPVGQGILVLRLGMDGIFSELINPENMDFDICTGCQFSLSASVIFS